MELETRNSFLYPIAKADRTRTFYIDTPAGRSERRTITVLPVPRFESVTVTYDPPAYTGWKQTTEYLSPQGIRALSGTTVTITVKSNLPLARGELTLVPTVAEDSPLKDAGPAETEQMQIRADLRPDPIDPRTAAVTLPLLHSSSFTLALVAANKEQSRSLKPIIGKIEALPDAPPRVSIVEPLERQIIAPVDWKVPVVIEAEDDVKVERVLLFKRVNELPGVEVKLPLLSRTSASVQAKHEIDLAALDAAAGDTITFFATAHDNSPARQSSDTETYVIHVISMEDYQNHARSQYQMEEVLAEIERFDALLRALDDQREKLLAEAEALQKKIADQGGKATPEDEKKLAELNAKLAQYAEDQWKLAQEMRDRSEQPSLYDFERAYTKMLAEQAGALQRGAEDATKVAREHEYNKDQKPGDAAEALRHLAEMAQQLKKDEGQLDEAQAQAKAADQDMQLIAKADRIMAQAQRVPALVEAQRDLANRLAPLKDRNNLTAAEQIRAQRLAMEQQALKEELTNIVKELDAAADAAQAQLPNMTQSAREIAAKIRELKIEADQADAEQAAMQGDGGKAHALAQSAATKLESLLTQSENMGEQGQSDFADAKFQLQKQSLGQGLQQLSQGRNLPKLGEGQPGQSASNNPGQVGKAGSQGARGKMSVYGPRSTGQSGAQRRGRGDGTGAGTGTGADEAQAGGAENLSPDSAAQRGSGATAIPGVPPRYVDLAEQYFRRLAEEAK